MRDAFGFLFYIGIGALLCALAEGGRIDWDSAWTYAWLFAWPIALFVALFIFVARLTLWIIAVFAIIAIAICVLMIVVDRIDDITNRRRGLGAAGASWKKRSRRPHISRP